MAIEPSKLQGRATGASDAGSGGLTLDNTQEIAAARPARPPFLMTIVFVAGISSQATQMVVSRLVAPHFGTSLLVWANLIGLLMIYLSVGYWLGGKLADRFPRPSRLYLLTGLASLSIAAIPLYAKPVQDLVFGIFQDAPGGLFFGSFISMLFLFSLPSILLGAVSPWAVRLRVASIGTAGKASGGVSSLTTLGNIIGTFGSVFFIIPNIGANLTLFIAAALLFVFSALAFVLVNGKEAGYNTEPNTPALQHSSTSVLPELKTQNSTKTPFLLPIVFAGGFTVLALELCASRLILPYFGSSQLIWANLIGFVMIYLAVGYWLGGRLADKRPSPGLLYQLTALAALASALIPVIARPVLDIAGNAFQSVNGGLFYGSLIAIILLFSVPVILLGCVTPFALRLRLAEVQNAGKTSARVSLISTFGSVFGSFAPVLVLIPLIGTRNTLLLCGAVLLTFSLLGLYFIKSRRLVPFSAFVPVMGVIAVLIFLPGVIRPAVYGNNLYQSKLLYETESAHNYIQVVERNFSGLRRVDLVLNEGRAVHSIYFPDKNQVLTGGPWDFYMVAPWFNQGMSEQNFKSSLIIGLGAGTTPKQLTQAYGQNLKIEGVEIDDEIIKVGQKYFDMNGANLKSIAEDGRYYLATSKEKYDMIGVDAYKQPYIPFHLTTQEFFVQVKDHLTPQGVVVVNAGTPGVAGNKDYRVANVLASTLKSLFPNVYMIDVPGYQNTMVIATNQPTSLENFRANIEQYVSNDLIKVVGRSALQNGNVREFTNPGRIFTDDLAPVEQIIDQVILDYVGAGGK